MFDSNTAEPVFFRTYSRRDTGTRESWDEMCDRTTEGLRAIGKLTDREAQLIHHLQRQGIALPAGRWLWVGGTTWIEIPENFPGAFNCSSQAITSWAALTSTMDLAMMGCGTGAVLEQWCISKLPPIRNEIQLAIAPTAFSRSKGDRQDYSTLFHEEGTNQFVLTVGDSRQGWVDAYYYLLDLASSDRYSSGPYEVIVDLSHVRPRGEKLQGFGGTANPAKLADLFVDAAALLTKAVGRQLTAGEICLLIDYGARCVVAGNVRRSAGIRQFDANTPLLKENLWQQDPDGNWRIDPARDALRMANHTRVFHRKPTREECVEAVRKQFYSGEGAIQFAPEAIARSSADILDTPATKAEFIKIYTTQGKEAAAAYLRDRGETDEFALEHRLQRYALNPCAEITGVDFFCDLAEVHLNRINPFDLETQDDAFEAAALAALALLQRGFTDPKFQRSRDLDPIIGVSITGLFDFFVRFFGVDWLRWWEAGRPEKWGQKEYRPSSPDGAPLKAYLDIYIGNHAYKDQAEWYRKAEKTFLTYWRSRVEEVVHKYCDRHGLKRPNRFTTVQPSGTKSLLTGASFGWHPPKSQRYIRRMTFAKDDPVALACIDFGYSVVPSQSDKDEHGNLLNDPFDPRCTEWLVEIPVEVPWANLPGAEDIDVSRFSALAQLDFYMQVQRHYVTHNTSATIELRESEIEPVGDRIFQAIENNEGYISAALLARFDDLETYPRLPFEPIDKATYDRMVAAVAARRKSDDFQALLAQYDTGDRASSEAGPAGCDSDKCMLPEIK